MRTPPEPHRMCYAQISSYLVASWQEGDIVLRILGGLTYQWSGGLHHLWSWWSSYVVSNALISGSGTRREREGLVSPRYTRSISLDHFAGLFLYTTVRFSLVGLGDVKLRNGMDGARPWPIACHLSTWNLGPETQYCIRNPDLPPFSVFLLIRHITSPIPRFIRSKERGLSIKTLLSIREFPHRKKRLGSPAWGPWINPAIWTFTLYSSFLLYSRLSPRHLILILSLRHFILILSSRILQLCSWLTTNLHSTPLVTTKTPAQETQTNSPTQATPTN